MGLPRSLGKALILPALLVVFVLISLSGAQLQFDDDNVDRPNNNKNDALLDQQNISRPDFLGNNSKGEKADGLGPENESAPRSESGEEESSESSKAEERFILEEAAGDGDHEASAATSGSRFYTADVQPIVAFAYARGYPSRSGLISYEKEVIQLHTCIWLWLS
jgi:hypothetical protein